MKTKLTLICRATLLLALLATLNLQLSTAFAQGTAFTYQGQFYDGTNAATGTYDFTFALFSDSGGMNQVGATLTNNGTAVNNGLFTVMLDFGPGIFDGTTLWLQIGAETNGGGGGFTLLTPLQQLTPMPYAVYSTGAGTANNAATASSAYSATTATTATTANGVAAGAVTGAGIASGSVVKALNSLQDAVTLSPGANITITPSGQTLTIAATSSIQTGSSNAWSLFGNAGTSPGGGYFVGTTDNQPLELHVNGQPALRLEPGGGQPNVIGGSSQTVGGGSVGVTIAGGNANSVSGQYAMVGGGQGNSAGNNYATAGGGNQNQANNVASTVGGGNGNRASGAGSFVGGGGFDGTTSSGNTASGAASTVPGGLGNVASGNYSFCAGKNGTASDNNSFLWCDGSRSGVSQGANTFSVLATGGIYLFTTTGGTDVVLDNSGNLDFGTTTRQMLNLYSSPGAANNYAIGIQSGTLYDRCGNDVSGTGFAWYRGGSPTNTQWNPGTGGSTLMTLTSSGLTVNGAVSGTAPGSGTGVTGASTSGYGVVGSTTSGAAAVVGLGIGSGDGVEGYTTGTGAGVYGQNYYDGAGVSGISDSGYGVYGQSSTSEAIYGYNYGSENGVKGQSQSGNGVYGQSFGAGAGVLGYNASSGPAGYFQGRVQIIGNLVVNGTVTATSFISSSDRNLKENFQPVSGRAVLEKVAALPVSRWNYKQDTTSEHIGPMAQDFYAAFNVGPDDKHITTIDEGGVALAAIQGLNEKVEAGSQKSEARIQTLETENAELKQTNDSLEKRLAALEQVVLKQKSNIERSTP